MKSSIIDCQSIGNPILDCSNTRSRIIYMIFTYLIQNRDFDASLKLTTKHRMVSIDLDSTRCIIYEEPLY